MKIDILIPSHRREYRIKEIVGNWVQRAQSAQNITVWVGCEMEDQKVYNERLSEFEAEHVRLVPDTYGCYVEAINKLAKASKGEAIICAADDVVPCAEYDVIIEDGFRQNFPDFDGALKANDLIHTMEEASNTHPVIGRKFLDRFPWVYYPGYFALWADTEFAHISEGMNKVVRIPQLVLEHMHHSIGKTPRDYTHERPLSQNLSGERLFKIRKEEGFPFAKDGRLIRPEDTDG